MGGKCESKYFNVYFELDKEMIYETVNDGKYCVFLHVVYRASMGTPPGRRHRV